MNEEEVFQKKEKTDNPSNRETSESLYDAEAESLCDLEAALESRIDELDLSKTVTKMPREEKPEEVGPEETSPEEANPEDETDEQTDFSKDPEEDSEDEFSEFADEDDDWNLFKKGSRAPIRQGNEGRQPDYENNQVKSEKFNDIDGPDAYLEKLILTEDEVDDESDDDDEDFDDDVAYFQSDTYKRRSGKTLTSDQMEERRKKRITDFWNLVERRRKQIRWGLIGLIVLAAAAISIVVVRNWTYHSITELVVSEEEDTISVSYANINGKVLKYGVDSAMLVDHDNNMLWTISYDMSAPEAVLCGDTFAIYDSKGTSICICDSEGEIGGVSADMPIVKASVSRQGVVAALLEDGQNAWIKCYDKDGSEIVTLKTTFTNPGYPMDLGLSEDGTLLVVNYLYIDNGTPVSRVAFYNFGTVGQNQKDNLVTETEYRDIILPESEYIDSETCVVFREDGFSIFTGSQIPAENVKVDVDESIVSTFYNSEYIGLVLQNRDSDKEYLICVYNKKGREVLRKATDFQYESIELNDGQVVLSSKDEFCIYNLQGVEKYRGTLEKPARAFIGFGRNKFIYVTEDKFRIIQVR